MGGDDSALEVSDQEKSWYDHQDKSVFQKEAEVFQKKKGVSFDTLGKGNWSFMFKLKAENPFNKTYIT